MTKTIRADLVAEAKIAKAVAKESPSGEVRPEYEQRSDPGRLFHSAFPPLPKRAWLEEKREKLRGLVDLRKTVVITGIGEIGPHGSSRTRWEMEKDGAFSLEGVIELAWLTGKITFNASAGWVDVATGEPVADIEIKSRYEATILEHSGIRIVEPELFRGYDPSKKTMLHEVVVSKTMAPIEVGTKLEAMEFQRRHGADNVRAFQDEDGTWMVQLRKGATVHVPKAMRFDRWVAGQIPTGWSAEALGVPKDIANSVDPVALYALVSTAEALVSSGICDPYELYKYVHVSSVGNASGSGMGGMRSLARIFYGRKLQQSMPSDTMAESFINTIPAWINMLLLSSAGAIRTPVGACATAAESIDLGCDAIVSGKARVVVVGGYDDFGETGSYEFAQMQATNNSDKDRLAGRPPHQASRPMTSSRAGFVESQGAGIQILCDAELAISMGLPVYAIVGHTATATDGYGRSVPAPGRGILTTVREGKNAAAGLETFNRPEEIRRELAAIDRWEASARGDSSAVAAIANKKRAAVYDVWGQGYYKDTGASPLRAALGVWGLDVDDISAVSCHGTSTKLNDTNESSLVQTQLQHLGRTKGNVVPMIAQKYLTGHPKGPQQLG